MQSQGSTTEIMRINYRNDPDESFYVQAQEDRVTVFFSTVFQDETDNVFGKVFLQVNTNIIKVDNFSLLGIR